MKPSKDNLDQDAVAAAREFLLGRPESRGRSRDDRRAERESGKPRAPRSPGDASSEPASPAASTHNVLTRLELSAPDIRRTDSGWRARCIHKRGVDSRHVNDARYGGYVGSFMEALEVRDRFYRERGLPIPGEIAAVVDGERVAPEIVRGTQSTVVHWQGQEHEVTGADADEIATEIALDLFVEFLTDLQAQATTSA